MVIMQVCVFIGILIGEVSSASSFINCKLRLSWSRRPFAVDVVIPTAFEKLILSISGHVMKLSFLMAF